MKLSVSRTILERMVEVAKAAAPAEACGMLGGKNGSVAKLYELSNADASAEHYTIPPEEQFAAVKDMRGIGIRLAAIWHSHPATPARMSDEDIRLAYTPDVAYVIVSLAGPEPVIKGFEMINDSPVEITIEVTEELE